MFLRSWCESTFTISYPAGAIRKPMTHKYHELSFLGQSWRHIPPARSEEMGLSHMTCKLMKHGLCFVTCRLTTNQKLDASHVVKLKRWGGRSLQAEVGGASFFFFRWHAVMTPYKPDIDFKVDGAKLGSVHPVRRFSNHNHILGSIYCSVTPPSLYKGKG